MKKRILSFLVVMTVFVSIFSTSMFANAAESQEHTGDTSKPHIVFSGKENTNNIVNVNLKLSDEMKQGSPSALKLSMNVEVRKGDISDSDIQFSIEKQLKQQAAMTSVTYKNGKLVVYIASANALFTNDQLQSDNNIVLGELALNTKGKDFDVVVTPTTLNYVYQNQTEEKGGQIDCASYILNNLITPTPDPEEPTPDPENPNPDPEKPNPDPENPNPDPEKPNPDPNPENPDKPSGDITIPTPNVDLSTQLGVTLSENSNKILNDSISKHLSENFKDVLAALPTGYTLQSDVNFKELLKTDIDANTLKAIADALNENTKVGKYYDINIAVSALLDGKILPELNDVKISNTTEGLTFTLSIPSDLAKTNREYGVIRVHDGKVEELPSTMNEDGTITFTSDKFSVYALIYRDTPDGGKPSTEPMTNATTGDSNLMIILSVVIGTISLAVVTTLIVVGKKKRKN